jgi:hypothetical protein
MTGIWSDRFGDLRSLSCLSPPRLSFILTETEQALRVEVRDLFLIIRIDGQLIKESPGGSHAAV